VSGRVSGRVRGREREKLLSLIEFLIIQFKIL